MKNKGITEMFRLLWERDWSGLLYAPTNNGWLQLFRYGFVGGGAFVVDFGVYCILGWLGMQYLLAGIISFIVGFAFNFLVSRWMIFQSTASSKIGVGNFDNRAVAYRSVTFCRNRLGWLRLPNSENCCIDSRIVLELCSTENICL